MSERTIEYMRVRDLVPAPRNPNDHQTDEIRASISRYGYVEPMVLDERTGRMVAGHGRRDDLLAREAMGLPAPDGIKVDDDGAFLAPVTRGWASANDEEAEGYLISSNLEPLWKAPELAEMLTDLAGSELGLDGTGYNEQRLERMLEDLATDSHGRPTDEEDGSLLELVDVTIGEPTTDAPLGSRWRIGRHLLIVADVMTGHDQWAGELTGPDVIFCPYPGPFVPFTSKLDGKTLVMVQPEPYLAGHVIDKWVSVFGSDDVVRLS